MSKDGEWCRTKVGEGEGGWGRQGKREGGRGREGAGGETGTDKVGGADSSVFCKFESIDSHAEFK